jgi:serine/threonine-protein kinase
MGEREFLSASLACLLLGGFASVAAAQGYCGAIAYSPSTRAHGWAYDYASRREAESRALSECRRHAGDCVVPVWFCNACGALAAGSEGYGSGWGTSRKVAEGSALQSCRRYSGDCSVMRWVCTTR